MWNMLAKLPRHEHNHAFLIKHFGDAELVKSWFDSTTALMNSYIVIMDIALEGVCVKCLIGKWWPFVMMTPPPAQTYIFQIMTDGCIS